MAAPTECLLPSCGEEGGSSKDEVKKKPRGRPRKNGPEPCRSAANKADFFMPISWRKQQKKEVVQSSRGSGTEDPADDSARSKSKRRRQETGASGVEEVVSKRIQLGKSTQDSASSPSPVKNRIDELREASRLAAKEDVRRAAGKPMHPFFTRQVPAQKNLKKIELGFQSNLSGSSQISCSGGLLPCPPFHVTQLEEMEAGQLQWEKFRFVEVCQPGNKSCSFSESSEDSLVCRKDKSALSSLDQVLGQFSRDIFAPYLSNYAASKNAITGREDVLSYSFEDQLLRYLSNLSADSQELPWIQDCHDLGTAPPQERLRARAASLKACRLPVQCVETSDRKELFSSAANSLWTDCYRPKSPLDVCGNRSEVGLLNSWLASWRKYILSGKRSVQKLRANLGDDSDGDDDKSWNGDSGSDCSDSGSDTDLTNDERLQNTLLLTGPVGCGKTAAVYACAREQGFSVIEVSTADLRNGSLIKQKFGEALESHGLRRWSAGSSSRIFDTQSTGLQNSDGSFQDHHPDTERVQLPSAKVGSDCSQGAARHESKGRKLTVILFEDADIMFDDDRGFVNALVKLAATTKRPIILTSNKLHPALPLPLRKFTVGFKHPCTQNLVLHACMVINVEGVPCCPRLMECVVKACRHDIRQVMLVLQFWSQGHSKDVQSLAAQSQMCKVGTREDQCLADGCSSNGISAVVGLQQSELTTASDENDKVSVAGQLPEGYLFTDSHKRLQSILLPLSFPFSLSVNVATKVSEAALQLHICATFAGVISNQDPKQATQASYLGQALGRVVEAANGLVADPIHDNRIAGTCYRVCTSPVKSLKVLRSVARSIRRLHNSCGYSKTLPNIADLEDSGCQTAPISGEKCALLSVGHDETLKCSLCKVRGSQGKECGHLCVDSGKVSEPASEISGVTICEAADFSTMNGEWGHIAPNMAPDAASIQLNEEFCEQSTSLWRLQQFEKGVLDSQLESLPAETVDKLSTWSGGTKVVPCGDLRHDSQCGMALDQPVCHERVKASHDSLTASESCMGSLGVVGTIARLTDDLSFFDLMSSHSAWEVEDGTQEETVRRHFGFHRDSLEEEAAYLVDCSVQLCSQQCSKLMDLAYSGKPRLNKSEGPQQTAQPGSDSFDWLASDANPCDVDHTIRRAAKEAMLKNIVFNLLPSRSKAAATGPHLHDYTMSLARMCKLEEHRKASIGKQVGPGLRRSGRRFLHHLAGSVPESDISGLLSHAELERDCTKSCVK